MSMIPVGKYIAQPREWQLGLTSAGKEQVEIKFEIIDANAGDHVGREMSWFGYFSEKTIDSTLKTLRLCGLDSNDIAAMYERGPDAVDVQLVIEHEPDQNNVPRERIRWVNDPNRGGMVSQRMEQDRAKAFAAQMRGKLAAIPKRQKPEEDLAF